MSQPANPHAHWFIKILRSFIYATNGMVAVMQERNMRVHVLATLVICILASSLRINFFEWMVVLVLIGGVWMGEMLNTAIEELANILRDELHLSYDRTKRLRDIAAGAVFAYAIAAALVGAGVFLPKILALLQ